MHLSENTISENTENQSSTTATLKFLGYLEIIVKRRKMILMVTISTFALLLVVSFLSPSIYQSTALIIPPQQNQDIMGLILGGMGHSMLPGSMLLSSLNSADQYASILLSERIKDSIIDQFKLMEEYKVKYRLKMYKKMDKIVIIKAGKKDGIITIAAVDEDPKKAADIANAYIVELGKIIAKMNMSGANENRSFIEERLTRAKTDLARAEDALNVFQSKNKSISVSDQAKVSIESVAMLKAQLAIQEAHLSSLRNQFTDSAQEVKIVKSTLSSLNSQIARLEGNEIGTIPSIGSVPDLGQAQVRLQREFKMQEHLVEILTKAHEISKLDEAKNIGGIQIIQKAQPSDYIFKSQFRKRYVLTWTFLVFACAVSWALYEDYREKMPLDQKERLENFLSLIIKRKNSPNEKSDS